MYVNILNLFQKMCVNDQLTWCCKPDLIIKLLSEVIMLRLFACRSSVFFFQTKLWSLLCSGRYMICSHHLSPSVPGNIKQTTLLQADSAVYLSSFCFTVGKYSYVVKINQIFFIYSTFTRSWPHTYKKSICSSGSVCVKLMQNFSPTVAQPESQCLRELRQP